VVFLLFNGTEERPKLRVGRNRVPKRLKRICFVQEEKALLRRIYRSCESKTMDCFLSQRVVGTLHPLEVLVERVRSLRILTSLPYPEGREDTVRSGIREVEVVERIRHNRCCGAPLVVRYVRKIEVMIL